MASLRNRGGVWHYRYVDADGVQHERKGCPDRRVTEAMAAAAEAEVSKVRAGLIDPKAVGFRTHEGRLLSDHLDDFQALVTRNRASKVLTLAKAKRVSDLSLSKAQVALAVLRSEGLGAETVNHYTRAVKGFSRWLWRDGRAREHALAHLATSNPEADRRRRRRTLTHEEANCLVQAAERGPVVMGMTGPDRARLYALALGTGFRANELASLTPERFDLAASPPDGDGSGRLHEERQGSRPADRPCPGRPACPLARHAARGATRLQPDRSDGRDDPDRSGGRWRRL
jgi:hypothetical protein